MTTEFDISGICGICLRGLVLTVLIMAVSGCDHLTKVNVDRSDIVSSQNSPPSDENGESVEGALRAEFAEVAEYKCTKRIGIPAAMKKIGKLQSVELFGSSGRKGHVLPAEFGDKILRLVSKLVAVTSETEDEETLAFPTIQARFYFEDSCCVDMSFFDDYTVWIFADNGGEVRDVSGDIEEFNDILKDLPFRLPVSRIDVIQVSDVLKVELHASIETMKVGKTSI